jgi:hypothetical protein
LDFLLRAIFDVSDVTLFSFSLPWQGLKAGTKKQKYEKISEKKVATSIEVLVVITSELVVGILLFMMLSFCFRLYVVGILLSSHHISIIAALFGLMTSLIIPTLSDCSVTSLSVKVGSFFYYLRGQGNFPM